MSLRQNKRVEPTFGPHIQKFGKKKKTLAFQNFKSPGFLGVCDYDVIAMFRTIRSAVTESESFHIACFCVIFAKWM